MDHDFIKSVESVTRLQMIHPIAVLELAFVIHPVATAIPWLYADERRVLMRRRPETNQRRVRVDRQIGTRLVVEQVDTLDLAVLQNERVDIERMGIEREKAILPDRHGANLIAHTTLFRQNPIGQVRTVKKEIAVDRFRMGVIRIIERGMGSYLKMERRRPRIRDRRDLLKIPGLQIACS